VHAKIVRTTHRTMHHERHRQRSLLTGHEDHRTDGRHGRSTSRRDFDVRLLFEAQRRSAGIGDFK
jgi:hypothetical protein